MKRSKYLQEIGNGDQRLYFHSLLGNLYLLNQNYISVLDSVSNGEQVDESDIAIQKIIKDLTNSCYLIEDGVDERRIIKERNDKWIEESLTGSKVYMLGLTISESCNFGCPHCLHSCSLDSDVEAAHGNKKFMDWDIAKKSIDLYLDLMKKHNKTSYIYFGSAEPLLNWKLIKKIVNYVRVFDKNGTFGINTNLSLLTKEQALFFKKNNVSISTSLDGPKDGNDSIRTFNNGKGTFDSIIRKFDLLRVEGYPLDGFSITINDLNFHSITPKFINWAKSQGFSGIATDVDLINDENCNISMQDYIDKLMEIRGVCVSLGIENFGSWTTPYYNLVNEVEDKMPSFCKAVKGQSITVNPEGSIFICGHTTTKLGHIDNIDTFFREDSSYVKMMEERLPGNDEICFGCVIEGICSGQCHITREVSQNTSNNKFNVLCEFYKNITFKLLEEKLKKEIIV